MSLSGVFPRRVQDVRLGSKVSGLAGPLKCQVAKLTPARHNVSRQCSAATGMC